MKIILFFFLKFTSKPEDSSSLFLPPHFFQQKIRGRLAVKGKFFKYESFDPVMSVFKEPYIFNRIEGKFQ